MIANGNNKCSMKKQIREIIAQHVGGTYEAKQKCAKEILHLFSISKRFNLPNFIAGIMVGILICTIIIELAY